MILCYTEEQKQVITSAGMMVIEYKRLIHTRDRINKAVQSFSDMVRELVEKMRDAFAALGKALRDCVQHIENEVMAKKANKNYEPVILYEKVKIQDCLCRVYRIYRCRNNC